MENCVVKWSENEGLFLLRSRGEITNCLFFENDFQGVFFNESDFVVCNNIFYGNLYEGIHCYNSDLLISHNNFYSNEEPFAGCSMNYGKIVKKNPNGYPSDMYNNIFEDPLFIGADSGNYNLLYGSPLIDAGDTYEVDEETDIAGYNRVFNGNFDYNIVVDIGPYEFYSNYFEKTDVELLKWLHPVKPEDYKENSIIKVRIKNNGTKYIKNLKLAYSIDDGNTWEYEELRRGLPANNITDFEFSKPVNLLEKKFFFAKVKVLVDGDEEIENNLFNAIIRRNRAVQVEKER